VLNSAHHNIVQRSHEGRVERGSLFKSWGRKSDGCEESLTGAQFGFNRLLSESLKGNL
jgi:hypothetical protein